MKAAEYNAMIPITDMAEFLGYVLNTRKGHKNARWHVYDKYVDGQKDHSIVVNRIRNTYFCKQTGERGTLFDFVKNRVREFPSWKPCTGQNTDTILAETKYVLDDYLGQDSSQRLSAALPVTPTLRSFSLADYEIYFPHPEKAGRQQFLLEKRCLDVETVKRFLEVKAIAHVKEKGKEYAYSNYGFPMRIPGSEKIVNFELRNYNSKKGLSFKGFCPGGNKSEALWMALFAPAQEITDVFVFESAIDAMSFYEMTVHHQKMAFISCGGYMTFGGISKLPELFPNAQFHSCCDNDTAGKLYDIMLAYYLQGIKVQAYETETKPTEGRKEKIIYISPSEGNMEFFPSNNFDSKSYLASHRFTNVIVRHCAQQFKDWNEQLCQMKDKKQHTHNDNQTLL